MLSGKAQAATTPTALGSLLQASTYGATIPNIYGMTLSPLLAIWAANLRQGGSVKKFKQFKKGITAYVENIDFLLGANPIVGVQQLWINGANIPLLFGTVPPGSNPALPLNPFLTNATLPTDILNQIPDAPPGDYEPYADFYAVIGITATLDYSVTFDDYGGTGPQTLSGSFEAPLWNVHQNGPDPNDSGAFKYFPLTYEWLPGDGPIIGAGSNDFFVGGPDVTIYVSTVTPATSFQPPLAKYRMAFEPELGSGTEYSDAGLPDQQIIYPMFAGIGSSDIDLGSSGALPQLQAEVQGKFGVYATGDCDFADIIEDTVKSGITQAAIGAGDTQAGVTAVEHGLSGYDFPGVIQKRSDQGVESFTRGPLSYPINVTEGNFLVVIAFSGAGLGVSDTLANSWTPVFSVDLGYQVWYAQANGSGANTVTITNSSGTHFSWQIVLMEIAGVDTFDGFSVGDSTGRVSIPATNAQGFPEYLLDINIWIDPVNPVDPQNPLWPVVVSGDNYYFPSIAPHSSTINGGSASSHTMAVERRIYTPGTYGIQQNTNVNGTLPDACCMLAFKCVNPPSYPRPVGDFMDGASLDAVRRQCRAYGLYGSLSMNSQQAASDWLKTLYDSADAAPVFMGFQLFSFPYAEVSAVGNGSVYIAPTASGPIVNLNDSNGDFVAANGDAPIKVTGTARVDQPNVLQMQCINRTSNYNPSLVSTPDAASISLFSVRKADPITNNAVQDVTIARALLGIQVRKLQYGGDNYTFTLPAKWCLLAPMDLITVTDTLADINQIPVRLTSIVEQSDQSLECEAEPFVYGMYAPTPFSADTPAPYAGNPNAPVPGAGINPPIIFEPTPRLSAQASPAQIWLVTSCAAANYGGCIPYISTDGGASYQLASTSPIVGSAVTGFNTADWPASSDPDTTNNLALTLAESLGTLTSYSASQRDNFQYPCYIARDLAWIASAALPLNFTIIDTASHRQKVTTAGTTGATMPTFNESGGTTTDGGVTWTDQGIVSIPYELMTYNAATLTGTNLYTLEATGAGNELRRGVFAAPSPGVGVDHPFNATFGGCHFAFLPAGGPGVISIDMDPAWIGVELFFKFPAYNTFGGAAQALTDAVAYPYTPTGIPGGIGPATGFLVNGS